MLDHQSLRMWLRLVLCVCALTKAADVNGQYSAARYPVRPSSPDPSVDGASLGALGQGSTPYSAVASVHSPLSGHAALAPPAAAAPGTRSSHSLQARAAADCIQVAPIDFDWNHAEIVRLPSGLLYRSYLAGEKEPRISSAWLWETDRGLVWDVTLGGRVGLWRYGTPGAINPQGFQIDVEGAAMVRLDPEQETDVEAADFRFGGLLTWRDGPWSAKAGYYHVSSHLGDEFLLRNPGFPRRNYVRDAAVVGLSFDATPEVRLYSEVAYAVGHEGGAEPLELQYGAEYAAESGTTYVGGPYLSINGHSREDLGWITGVNIVSGWQWQGRASGQRFRVGVQYYNGPALQYSFVGQQETLVGGGLWFDY